MYIELDDRPIQLSGSYRGGSAERVLSWRDRTVETNQVHALHLHIEEGHDAILDERKVRLSPESFEDLLLHGIVHVVSEQEARMRGEQIFGEIRAMLHAGPLSMRSWWRLCALLDLAPVSQRASMVHYVEVHLDRAEPEARSQALAARYRGGVTRSRREAFGALCVAPRRWLKEVARGEKGEKYGLVRRLVVDRRDLGLVERALVTHERGFELVRSLEFWQVERRVARSRTFKAPPHTIWRALCEPPLLDKIERLRLCAMQDDCITELQRYGNRPGALRTIDISAIPFAHKRLAGELFEIPYLSGLEELVCNGPQLRSFMASRAPGMPHLSLIEGALDQFFKDVIEDGRFAAKFAGRLKTLSFYDYPYGKRWEPLFDSHYEGEIETLHFGVGFTQHALDLREDTQVEHMLWRSKFLESVRTLVLGDMLDVIDLGALEQAHPHLKIVRDL